jgi:hypothetical protein
VRAGVLNLINRGLMPVQLSIFGFLVGFSVASGFAAFRLLDEYKQASAALQLSVEELQRSTEKVCTRLFVGIKRRLTTKKDIGTRKAYRGSRKGPQSAFQLLCEQGRSCTH